MVVDDLTKPDLENASRNLSSAFQGLLSWKWDKRFETLLAEFLVNDKDKIREILERHLNHLFNSSNVGNAPGLVRQIDDRFGGLWPGQLLFTSDPNEAALLFCTWWPWGDGKSISIRIGAEYKDLSNSEHDKKLQLFKGWFGV